MCGGTVNNPDYEEGQITWTEQVLALEAQLTAHRSCLREVKVALENAEGIIHSEFCGLRDTEPHHWKCGTTGIKESLAKLSSLLQDDNS